MKSKKYNTEEDFISKWEPYFQKVADLQDLLFGQLPDCDVKDFIPKIPDYFFKSKIQLIQLFSSIYSLHFARINHRDFCFQLIKELLPQFLCFLSKSELASLFEFQSKYLFLQFYELGIITIDQILNEIKLLDDPNNFLYFHDIIEEESITEFNNLKLKYKLAFNNADLRDFKNRRQIGKNDSPIALSIREDDIDKCQSIMSANNIGVDSRIPYSLYESLVTVNQQSNMPFLLEYAAFFGSIKCFKYFIMNNATVTDKLIPFAIFGGNLEIIHICESAHAPLSLALRSSICCFRDDCFDYFQDSQDIEFTNSAICCAIRNYNANAIINCLHRIYKNPNIVDDRQEYPILISASKNYIDIFLMLTSLKNIDYNVMDQNGDTSIILSAINQHVSIFQILIENDEVNVNAIDLFGENLLTKLVEKKCKGLLMDALQRNDINIMDPATKDNEIFTAIYAGDLSMIKFLFNHKKYQEKAVQAGNLELFIISAALNDKWDLVDYLIGKCNFMLKLLKIVDLFFYTKSKCKDQYHKLRETIIKYLNMENK